MFDVEVKTSDKMFAGTDNDVLMTLIGEDNGRQC